MPICIGVTVLIGAYGIMTATLEKLDKAFKLTMTALGVEFVAGVIYIVAFWRP